MKILNVKPVPARQQVTRLKKIIIATMKVFKPSNINIAEPIDPVVKNESISPRSDIHFLRMQF